MDIKISKFEKNVCVWPKIIPFHLQIINLWQNTDFHLSPHQGRDTFIIAGADDIMAQLEESQVTIGTIKASRYIAPIQVCKTSLK